MDRAIDAVSGLFGYVAATKLGGAVADGMMTTVGACVGRLLVYAIIVAIIIWLLHGAYVVATGVSPTTPAQTDDAPTPPADGPKN